MKQLLITRYKKQKKMIKDLDALYIIIQIKVD